MILKLQTKTGWVYFGDIDGVEVYDQERNIDEPEPCNTQCFFLSKDSKMIKVVLAYRNQEMVQRIKVDSNPMYLMSDGGKTIEKLN